MKHKLVTNLSGGINCNTNPLIIQDGEFESIVNYQLDTIGSLVKRNGYDVYGTQPIAARRILGMAQYTNTSSSAETTQVLVINNAGNTNAVIYYNNSGTWSTSKTNDTAVTSVTNFNRTRFVTFLDYLFRVNGVDAVGSSNNVNGSSWGTTNCPTTITPSFINVFQDRVYVARNGTSAASRVYFSSLPDTTITWDTTNDWFDVNPDDGDEITGLENNGDKLLIFKHRAMYRWSFGQTDPDRIIGIGTDSQESIKTNLDLGITFFANSKGVYAYTGGRPKIISRKIQPWIDAVSATEWDDVCAEVDDNHYYLYLSDSLTVNGVTYTNVMAVYNIALNAWTIYCLHAPWRIATKFIISSVESIYFGSSNGRIYLWDSGNEDDSGGTNGNTAQPINTEAITKEYLLTFPAKTTFERADFISQNSVTTQTFYRLDRKGDFQPLNQISDRFITSRHVGRECNSIQLKFTDSTSLKHKIEGFNIRHEPKKLYDRLS